MSNPYWSQYPQSESFTPPSRNSDVPLEYRMEQMKLLGRIEEAVRPIPEMQEDIQDLRVDLATHIASCNQPRERKKVLSVDNLKENLAVVIFTTQALIVLALQFTGQPDKAQQVWGGSPAFQQGAVKPQE